ncbi:MAG: hypothetical protein V9G19_23860 [Tetrasphaera sp.]
MSGSPLLGDVISPPSVLDPAQTGPQLLSGVSRRTSLAAVAALAAPALTGRLRPIQLGRTYRSTGRSLGDLTGMLGANVITSTKSGPYGQQAAVLQALRDIGATWIRTRIHTGNRGQVAWINQLAASGIQVNGLVDLPGGKDSPEALVNMVATSLPGAIWSLEGPNEWNLKGGAGWVSELVAHQTRLWNAAKGNTVTRNIPIVGPALGMRKGYTELGDRTSIMDWGNIHLYTGGYVPGYRTDGVLQGERIVCGSKPIIVTETGWHNAAGWSGPHYYTPEDVAGLYAPRLLLEYFIRDVPKLSIYQLLDNPSAPNAREQNFGLMHTDLSRKPAFQSLANLHTILTRTYRTTGRPGQAAEFSFRGGPADLRSALVDRGDGRRLLFLWRSEASVYEPKTRQRLTPTPATATIEWGQSSSIQYFAPATSANAVRSEVTSVSSVSLGAEMQILEVSPS